MIHFDTQWNICSFVSSQNTLFFKFLSHGFDLLSGKTSTGKTFKKEIAPFLGQESCFLFESNQSVQPYFLSRSHQTRARKIAFIQLLDKYVHYVHVKPSHHQKRCITWSEMTWGAGAECSLVTWSQWSPEWPVWWAGWSQTGCTFSSSACPSRRFEQDNRDCLKQML